MKRIPPGGMRESESAAPPRRAFRKSPPPLHVASLNRTSRHPFPRPGHRALPEADDLPSTAVRGPGDRSMTRGAGGGGGGVFSFWPPDKETRCYGTSPMPSTNGITAFRFCPGCRLCFETIPR
jgi:hypothetical protein